MEGFTEIAKVIIKDNNGAIISEIICNKITNDKLYTIQDIVSDKVFKISYVMLDTFLIQLQFLKEISNLNIEIVRYD